MRLKISLFFLDLITFITGYSQNIQIANWYQNKKSATVFTFDDWSPGQYSFLLAQAQNKKIPFSVYVTISNYGNRMPTKE